MQLGFIRCQVEDALYICRGDVTVAGERLAQEQDCINRVAELTGCDPFEAYRILRRVGWRVNWAVEDIQVDMAKDSADRQKRRERERKEQEAAAKAAAERQVQLIGERLVELVEAEPEPRREVAREHDTAHKALWDAWVTSPAAEEERRKAQHKQAAKAKSGGGASKVRLQTELKKLRRDGMPQGVTSFVPDQEEELTTTAWTAELAIPHGARARLTVRPGGEYPKQPPEVRVEVHGAGACASVTTRRRVRLPIAAAWKAKNQLIDAVVDCARLFDAAAADEAPPDTLPTAGSQPADSGLPSCASDALPHAPSSFYDATPDDSEQLAGSLATLAALGWSVEDIRLALRTVGGDGGRAAALLVGDDVAAGLE